MWYDKLIARRLEILEVQYFLHDPDGDPDRAGDGYYYREPDAGGWSGAWYDEDECLEIARETFEGEYNEIDHKGQYLDEPEKDGVSRFLASGKCALASLGHDPFAIYWAKRLKGGKYAFSLLLLAADKATAKERVVGRLGDKAKFNLERVNGSLIQICHERGLDHPIKAAQQKVLKRRHVV